MEKQESQIEGYFVRQFKKYFPSSKKGLLLKYTSSTYTGMPDRDVLVKGLPIIKVELKSPTGRLKPKQKNVHKVLRGLGIEVHTFSTKEEVDIFLKDLHVSYTLGCRIQLNNLK